MRAGIDFEREGIRFQVFLPKRPHQLYRAVKYGLSSVAVLVVPQAVFDYVQPVQQVLSKLIIEAEAGGWGIGFSVPLAIITALLSRWSVKRYFGYGEGGYGEAPYGGK